MGSVATRRRARLRRFAAHAKIAMALSSLLKLVEVAKQCDTSFSRFLSCASDGKGGKACAWSRDVFPLPWACDTSLQLPVATSRHCSQILRTLVNYSVPGTNYMYANLRATVSHARPSLVQRRVLASFEDRWWRMACHVHSCNFGRLNGSSFRTLVEQKRFSQVLAFASRSRRPSWPVRACSS